MAQNAPHKGCAVLTPTYAWVTEGFNTQDLPEAKALLSLLGAPERVSSPWSSMENETSVSVSPGA
jgi:hypothetical protein